MVYLEIFLWIWMGYLVKFVFVLEYYLEHLVPLPICKFTSLHFIIWEALLAIACKF